CVPHAFACPRALRRGCTVRAGGPRWPGARGRGGIPAWARGSVRGRGSLLILVSSRRTCKRRLGFGPVAAASIPPNPTASLVPDVSIIQGHPSLLIAFSARALRWHPVCSLGGGKQLDDSLRLRGIRTRTVWADSGEALEALARPDLALLYRLSWTPPQRIMANNFELLIRPSAGWRAINWREVWHFRELFFFLVW